MFLAYNEGPSGAANFIREGNLPKDHRHIKKVREHLRILNYDGV